MKKHWISYFLVVLIACQSVLAIAGLHEARITLPEIGLEKIDIVKSEIKVNEVIEQDINSIISVDGCDYCGLCHYGQVTPSDFLFSRSPNTYLFEPHYIDVASSAPLFFLYRPPKV